MATACRRGRGAGVGSGCVGGWEGRGAAGGGGVRGGGGGRS